MANTKDVLLLIKELGEKTCEAFDHAGFGKMSELIEESNISQRFLYDLYRRTTKLNMEGVGVTRARQYYLNAIAKYLGYKSFLEFSIHINKNISENLKSCEGNWWSYVRASAKEALYKAPVRIFSDANDGTIRIELRGKERLFFGEIKEKAGCLFIHLVSGADKQMGMVFKLGATNNINVLQGTFSGMSTAGYPIAGREILVRELQLDYENMTWEELDLQNTSINIKIRNFFSNSNDNCIGIVNITGFEINNIN